MKKITFEQLTNAFYRYNVENKITYGSSKPALSGVIVYKQSNFTQPYSVTERSYRITNQSGKRFFPNMISNSYVGNCLDEKDLHVRLDCYNWGVEYCYLEENHKK